MPEPGLEEQQTLVAALRAALGQGAAPAELFETHISWVIVAGPAAYKIKKAVRFDFLDFSTLAARRHFCQEELRLNRRLAPQLYLGVAAVTGSAARPQLEGAGAPIEYAVRMRAFAQDALWSRRIERHLLAAPEIDELAGQLATFHLQAARAPPQSRWGAPDALRQAAEDNIALLESLLADAPARAHVAQLRAWQQACLRTLRPVFERRKADGHVREGHGDLHCGNILTLDGKVAAFDCIEFDAALRWIDVMHDIAFVRMDLRRQGLGALAARLLNAYLELTGDYEGVAVLHYYEAQCALVRTKIALLRARQADATGALACRRQADALLAAAHDAANPPRPAIVVLHGLTGSGKSTVARELVELLGAVQLRSDVERKRMHGIGSAAGPAGAQVATLYSRQATEAVYLRLRVLAASLAEAGMTVVVDACSLKRQERAAFEAVAAAQEVPLVFVDVHAREATMRERIIKRRRHGADPSDADEAVLDLQLRVDEPLSPRELERAITLDSEIPFDREGVRAALARLLANRAA